jgi:hypothetical protein
MKTTEEINEEYSRLCAKLGDLKIKRGTLEHQENEIIKEIAKLSKEMQTIKEKQGETEQ